MSELLVRVRVVKSLAEGDKLKIRNGHVSIDKHGMWTPMWRWFCAEDRMATMAYLNGLVNDIEFRLFGDLKKTTDSWESKSLAKMVPELATALERLSHTYIDDVVMVSHLETIIERLNHFQLSLEERGRKS